jgi:hypothetical protein
MEHRHAVNQHLRKWRLWCLSADPEEMNEPDPALPLGLVVTNALTAAEGGPTLAYGIEPSAYGPASEAALQFALFITSPNGQLLGRCERCQRYFLNTSGHRNKKYCRPECARDVAARRATKRARRAEHEAKLQRLRRAAAAFHEKPPNRDAKEWLAKRAKVSVWFITRALNRGEVCLPSQDRGDPNSGAADARDRD